MAQLMRIAKQSMGATLEGRLMNDLRAKKVGTNKNSSRPQTEKFQRGTIYTVFRARRVTFFPVNRVEHQKLNQPAAEPPSG